MKGHFWEEIRDARGVADWAVVVFASCDSCGECTCGVCELLIGHSIISCRADDY